ncbi:MAG: hypothetical protein V4739_03760 [Pseudomonadota bacterium]
MTEALFNPPDGAYDVPLLSVRNPGHVISTVAREIRRVTVRR